VFTEVSEKSLAGTVICRLPGFEKELFGRFSRPKYIFESYECEEVLQDLRCVEEYVKSGNYAAGYITYEAAPAFDNSLAVFENCEKPLLWFGIYDAPEIIDLNDADFSFGGEFEMLPELSKNEYLDILEVIKEHIENGDIYQANFTYRLNISSSFNFEKSKLYSLFLNIMRNHPVPYGAYVDTGKDQILSFSPELFIERQGDCIFSRPMKGTSRRGFTAILDMECKNELYEDEKNRAENLMIVDMVRNDFGKICDIGSVKVERLFEIQTYPTLHQMISEVSGILPANISLFEILKAVFPAASITGAPKVMAMRIINELERSPRNIYTGTIGCMKPMGDICFNVPIRTLFLSNGKAELGIGSGIVADSIPEDEWDECILKSKFMNAGGNKFKLLETMLWDRDSGVLYANEHFDRMLNSAFLLGWSCDRDILFHAVEDGLRRNIKKKSDIYRIRLLYSPVEGVETEFHIMNDAGWGKGSFAKLKISKEHTNSRDFFLYHKTTRRSFYDSSFRDAVKEGYDEVVFFNEKKQLTEGAISNIFLKINGNWFTPALKCGLLSGIWREKTIKKLNAEAKILFLCDLQNADDIMVGNSVRGGTRAFIF